MDKRLRKVRFRMAVKKFFTHKVAIILSAIGVSIVTVGFIFLSWAITGGVQKIINFLTSPLAYFWYFVIAVALVSAWAFSDKKTRWRK